MEESSRWGVGYIATVVKGGAKSGRLWVRGGEGGEGGEGRRGKREDGYVLKEARWHSGVTKCSPHESGAGAGGGGRGKHKGRRRVCGRGRRATLAGVDWNRRRLLFIAQMERNNAKKKNGAIRARCQVALPPSARPSCSPLTPFYEALLLLTPSIT